MVDAVKRRLTHPTREISEMAYYFDHKHVKEDNPAAHTDNPMQIFLIYVVLVVPVAIANLSGLL